MPQQESEQSTQLTTCQIYYRDHKDSMLSSQHQYYQRKRDERLAYQRAYNEKNREQLKLKRKERRKRAAIPIS